MNESKIVPAVHFLFMTYSKRPFSDGVVARIDFVSYYSCHVGTWNRYLFYLARLIHQNVNSTFVAATSYSKVAKQGCRRLSTGTEEQRAVKELVAFLLSYVLLAVYPRSHT